MNKSIDQFLFINPISRQLEQLPKFTKFETSNVFKLDRTLKNSYHSQNSSSPSRRSRHLILNGIIPSPISFVKPLQTRSSKRRASGPHDRKRGDRGVSNARGGATFHSSLVPFAMHRRKHRGRDASGFTEPDLTLAISMLMRDHANACISRGPSRVWT